MATQTRDPLAEHPLGDRSAAKPDSEAENLELFSLPADEPAERKKRSRGRSPGGASGSPSADAAPAPETETTPVSAKEYLDSLDDGVRISFTRRIVAGLADLLILALAGTVQLATGAVLLELRFPPAAFWGLLGFVSIVALVLLVLVPFVWGTTPGMALVDLRIRAEDGGSPTLGAAFLRFLGFAATAMTAGIPLLLAAFDQRGRTLSDFISKTTIVPLREEHEPFQNDGPE